MMDGQMREFYVTFAWVRPYRHPRKGWLRRTVHSCRAGKTEVDGATWTGNYYKDTQGGEK